MSTTTNASIRREEMMMTTHLKVHGHNEAKKRTRVALHPSKAKVARDARIMVAVNRNVRETRIAIQMDRNETTLCT